MTTGRPWPRNDVPAAAPDWVLAALKAFLDSDALGMARRPSPVEWRFESRYFSSLLYVTIVTGGAERARFVAKFPKATRGRGFTALPSRTSADIELSEHEYRAFTSLSRTWPRGDTAFVQPLFCDASTGMLVFKYLDGTDVYSPSIPRSLLGSMAPPALLAVVHRLGRALGQYHAGTVRVEEFDLGLLLRKIRSGASELNVTLPKWVPSSQACAPRSLQMVPSIKGFEIRNVRVAEGTIWLFDPGRLRDEPPEADVARFLVSLKMLGWGTPYFVWPLNTRPVEKAFVEGYVAQRSIDVEALALYGLREILWNWREALEVLALKGRPALVRSLIMRLYIAPGFRRMWRNATRGHFLPPDSLSRGARSLQPRGWGAGASV